MQTGFWFPRALPEPHSGSIPSRGAPDHVLPCGTGGASAEFVDDAADDPRAVEDQCGIHLKQGGASGHFLPGLLGGCDAAHADDRQSSTDLTMDVADDLRAAGMQGTPTHPPCLLMDPADQGILGPRPGDGRVGGHDPGEVPRKGDLKDLIQRLPGEDRAPP